MWMAGLTNLFLQNRRLKTSIFKKQIGTKCNTHLTIASTIQDRGNKRLINSVSCKDMCHLRCAAVSMDEWFLTFGRNSVSPTSGSPKNNSQYGINGGEV
jgi:hypothetical protein